MSEETQTPIEDAVPTKDTSDYDVVESWQADAAEKARQDALFTQKLNENARLFVDDLESAKVPTQTARGIATTTLVGVALAAVAGPVVGHAVDAHLDNLEAKNQQYIEQADANQQRLEFEEGMHSGKVTVEVPAIPAPEQE